MMLQTCNRCKVRRIKCDALLPACGNCAKVNYSCQFRDEVLQENIPRSYIKGLYDRINELNSLLSVQASQTTEDLDAFFNTEGVACKYERGHQILPSKSGQALYLGPSAPALLVFTTVSKLLSSKFDLEPPSIFGGEPSQVVCDFAKIDRSSVTPNTIRVLLAHYDRCISPLYLVIFSSFLTETETPLKHLTEFERFKVLIASGIAAAHKSYHDPNWRTIAKVCREWAGDLAVSIIAARDAEAVVALLLLLIYELADPDKCVIWELLGFATRICLELGWHRILQSNDEDLSLQDDEQGFSDYHKRQLMSVLHSIERRLRVIFHRPSMLSGCQPPSDYQDNMVFETYMEASSIVSGIEFFEGSNGCPESGRISALISTLETLPSENELVQETWLLFLPLCLEHIECGLCSKTSDQAPNTTMTNLQLKVLSCAVQLANSVHPSVSSPEVFMPPLVASTQAFMSGCVIVAGLTNRWPGTETSIGALLKCSETLSFFAPLWIGGSDYHEVWRKIVSVV